MNISVLDKKNDFIWYGTLHKHVASHNHTYSLRHRYQSARAEAKLSSTTATVFIQFFLIWDSWCNLHWDSVNVLLSRTGTLISFKARWLTYWHIARPNINGNKKSQQELTSDRLQRLGSRANPNFSDGANSRIALQWLVPSSHKLHCDIRKKIKGRDGWPVTK